MSKMSDMALTIEELRSAAAAIKDAADWLAAQFGDEPEATEAETPTPEPELKLEDVRAVLADMSRKRYRCQTLLTINNEKFLIVPSGLYTETRLPKK